ncbi:MAG: zf-HC2 domain-containing protein [Peptococcaceae bacterium]|nr:zf-HC2 domain-containing protein [Peptococcaceae bacterium]
MADCAYWEYQISLALDGELDPDGGDRLTRHLGECPRCRSVREAFEKSAQAIRTWPIRTLWPD